VSCSPVAVTARDTYNPDLAKLHLSIVRTWNLEFSAVRYGRLVSTTSLHLRFPRSILSPQQMQVRGEDRLVGPRFALCRRH
jgi:hypothetical protein